MKNKIIAAASALVLGILAIVFVARGMGGDVAAAEDERFKMNGTTLTRYLGSDTFVSLPDTVTAIGEEAFSGNETMTSIEIPDSVTSIAYNAFKDCTALTNVILPDSVEKVGPGAFEGCTALTNVEIGEGVSSWGSGVFVNCDSLAKVTIDKDNEYLTYYNGAIYNGNMTMLYQVLPGREGENYVMPDTVKDIDAYALWNMINTKNVKVSSAVKTVPKYALTNMGSVENVVLQDGATGIAEKALSDNANLKQAAVPSSVTSIDKKAFTGSPGMKILTTKSSTADTFGKNNGIEVIYKAEYPDDFMDSNVGLEEKPNVGEGGTSSNTTSQTTTTTTDTTVTTVTGTDTDSQDSDGDSDADGSAENGTGLTSGFESAEGYIHPLDVPEDESVKGKTVIVAGKAVALMNNHDMQVYGIPDGVEADVLTEQEAREQETETPSSISVTYQQEEKESESIPQRKFYQQKDLTDYEISETITSIGRLAFAESGLKKIAIPEGVTEIEYGAFMNCKALADVTIPDSVSSIGTKAFTGTAWLNDWFAGSGDADGDFLIVGDGVLLDYKGDAEHVEIPEGVKQIGSEVFKGHTEILDVDIPESVTKICAEAFRNCSSLTGLTGCEGLRTVIRGAFYGTQLSETEF